MLLELKLDQAVITPCNRYGTGFGKPRFPENVSQNTTLANLAGKDSWFTMNILQIDDQFLNDDVDTWSQSQAYQSSLRNILAVNAANDSAKSGVKGDRSIAIEKRGSRSVIALTFSGFYGGFAQHAAIILMS